MFCSIHNHTQYSNLHLRDSINRIPEMINKAIEYGFNGLAITDHEVISGHIEALNCGDKIREEHPNFKIILGNEIYLIDESEYKNADKYWHFILLAKDEIGHRQLRELSSQAWERSYMERGQRRTPTFYQDFERIIGENKGHLIASTACVGGRLGTSILRRDSESINFMVNWMMDTFGEGNCKEEIYKNVDPNYMITILRRMMYRIAEEVCKKRNLKVIINGESIGQVASQTLTSMKVINSVTNVPVIRPVACLDKLEIIDISKKIGYSVSQCHRFYSIVQKL